MQRFLVEMLLALKARCSPEKAADIASKMDVDGMSLYEQPKEAFLDTFGFTAGLGIYNVLNKSAYGYVSLFLF